MIALTPLTGHLLRCAGLCLLAALMLVVFWPRGAE